MKKSLTFLLVILLMLNTLSLSTPAVQANSAPKVIPALREWNGASGYFTPDSNTSLVNLSGSASVLKVQSFFKEMLSLDLKITDKELGTNEIAFVLDKSLSSKLGKEGYTLEADENRILIKSATDIGLLYGGITVVQAVTADKAFPCGYATDYPAYPVRSGMLDVGRAWIPLDYVEEITRYMAYFKMNEIHLHINDDGENGYSAFRLESDVPGLTAKDGFYSKSDYRAYQKKMLEYGVSVVTEIDTPFHSSCYASADNPPPYLPDNPRCLDISKPETLEFVKNLFNEYMTGDDPVFVGKVVHIGTDEYPRKYAEQMRAYTDALIKHVNSLGYTPRFWGGLGKDGFQGETPISEKAQLNFWDVGISGVQETLASKFEVINTVNMILYTVPTTNYAFPDYFNLDYLYTNWQVNLFDLYNSANSMPADDERLLGASFALWNDLHTRYHGVTRFDIFDRLRGMVCLVAEKTWCGLDTANIKSSDFVSRFNILSVRAGDSDPAGRAQAEINLDFESGEYASANGELVLDGSSFISLGEKRFGFPNTLEFDITLSEPTDKPLFSGDGCEIYTDVDGKGHFGFKTEVYSFVFDYKLPIGEKTHIRLTSDDKITYLTVNNTLSYAPKNPLFPNGTKLTTLTIPLKEIGKGIKGSIDNIKISPAAVDPKSFVAKQNIALNASATVSGLEVNDGRFTPNLAVDGDEGTRLSFAKDNDNQWLVLDLGDLYDISVIEISFFERVSEYEIYVSEDGESFTKVYSVSDGVEKVKQTDIIRLDKSVKARYIKYVQLKRWYASEWNTYYSGGISEFRAYSFDESRFSDIVDQAVKFLSEIEKSDPRRAEVRKRCNELESYLAEPTMFIGNLDQLYNSLAEALNAPAPEQSTSESVPKPQSPSDAVPKKNIAPYIALAVAGAAVLAAVAIALIKRKKK